MGMAINIISLKSAPCLSIHSQLSPNNRTYIKQATHENKTQIYVTINLYQLPI